MSTPMLGAGFAPAGTSPAGIGAPSTASAPAGSVFRDPYTGAIRTGRRIDPRTRQYVFDSNGRIEGIDTVPQLVQMAMSTEKGSSAMVSLGHELKKVTEITDNFDRRIRDTIDGALDALVKQVMVRIDSVDVERIGTSGAYIHVRWTDRTTGQEHLTSL